MIRKGTYVLFLRFGSDVETDIGSLGHFLIEKGDYCYVGSAMGGLDQRLRRHLSPSKKIRWHIDYLTTVCTDMKAYESEGEANPECGIAELMMRIGNVPYIKGFGCSDCHCQTHFFRVNRDATEIVLSDTGFVPFFDKLR